jgi:hypothetical protein
MSLGTPYLRNGSCGHVTGDGLVYAGYNRDKRLSLARSDGSYLILNSAKCSRQDMVAPRLRIPLIQFERLHFRRSPVLIAWLRPLSPLGFEPYTESASSTEMLSVSKYLSRLDSGARQESIVRQQQLLAKTSSSWLKTLPIVRQFAVP